MDNSMVFLLYVSLFAAVNAGIFSPTVTNETINTCYACQADFDAVCSQKFFGVAVGPRCYFPVDFNRTSRDGWTAAWTACRKYGAKLAHIHTSAEFDKQALGKDFRPFIPVLAMLDNTSAEAGPCTLDTPTSYWYINETTFVKNTMKNTWVGRYRNCDDNSGQLPPRCFGLAYGPAYGKPATNHSSGIGIHDLLCYPAVLASEESKRPLCEYTNFARNYTKTNTCITETPVEEMPVSQLMECVSACSANQWCRSFNFVMSRGAAGSNTMKCQLFNWSPDDTARKIVISDCYGYTYQ